MLSSLSRNEVMFMLMPSLAEAKKRSRKEVLTKTDEYIVKDNLKALGLGKKYYVKTYGCQMNEHDSEMLSAILEEMLFTKTDIMEDADIILLNTFVFSKMNLLCANAMFLSEQSPSDSYVITPIDFNLLATISFNSSVLIKRAHSFVHTSFLNGQFFIKILYTKIII